jgi:hypothetical protein
MQEKYIKSGGGGILKQASRVMPLGQQSIAPCEPMLCEQMQLHDNVIYIRGKGKHQWAFLNP